MSKRTWASITLVAAGLTVGGCQEPVMVDTAPPGETNRESLMPKEPAAEALGEMGGQTKPTVLTGLVLAPPTAKGETKTTPAGVQYQTLKEGTGETAKAGQTVTVHYVGTLENGKKFDSSRDNKGKPVPFLIGTGSVIRGWDEAVPGMRVGEVRKLIVPPAAGYGALGRGDSIPANATLIFEIELVKTE